VAVWLLLPPNHVLAQSLVPPEAGERTIALSEGATELIAVREIPGRGRGLITNGHAMSSTAPLDQRYMRALAHLPLLAMEQPRRVLVIGFGVGNTTHAATLHPSVQRVDVADLSRHVLEHAGYFRDANHDVLRDPKVTVFLNDGRQHLQMQPPASYDLITLEPPPISHAGVAALYSREFYALARSRLTPGGYVSQWLPAYQVPAESSLAMVRAFVDVFPQAVLLSGAQAELLLVGTTAPRIEIVPHKLQAALQRAPAVRDDLARVDLGQVHEIIGTFVAAAPTLTHATAASQPVTDDRPLQEYGVRSVIGAGLLGVPASLFNLGEVAAWCPACFDGDEAPSVAGLGTYLTLMQEAYAAPVAEVAAAAANGERRVLGSRYLGAVVPPRADLIAEAEYDFGELDLEAGRYPQAVERFRASLAARPDSAGAHNNLGVALASMGAIAEAAEHFRAATTLDPTFTEARNNLARATH
jgi:spermidine synthase